MKAYSIDLRQRAIDAYDAREGTQEQVAARFAVSTSWVRKLLRQRRATGSIDPKPHGGGHAPAFDTAAGAKLRQAVRDDSDATLEELGPTAGVACSPSAVFRRRTGWGSREKKVAAGGRAGPARAEGRAGGLARGVRRDRPGAAGLHRRDRREHGDGPDLRPRPSGVRVDGPVPHGHWKVTTLTAAVRLGGVPEQACLAFDGATDSACFVTYVGQCLAPALRPGDIVVMDNLACHKAAEVARLIGAAGAEVRYLPAYSPDLNPIERLFSKLKEVLRSAAARTVDAVVEAMGQAVRAVRPGDIRGWFAHSGYATQPSTVTVDEKSH